MTPNETFEAQLVNQIGSACLTIAKQAAAVTELQNQLAEVNAKIAELEKQKSADET